MGHPLSAGPQDFAALDTLLTFNSNTGRVLVNISIINDEVDENQENLFTRLRLESVDASVSVAPDEATILIVDDDGKQAVNRTSVPSVTITFLLDTVITVELENRTYTVPENEGPVEVCAVIVRGSLERTVTVSLSTEDGSAKGWP